MGADFSVSPTAGDMKHMHKKQRVKTLALRLSARCPAMAITPSFAFLTFL
jgi:hypothetical protein